jgi:STE24 endopeptidase
VEQLTLRSTRHVAPDRADQARRLGKTRRRLFLVRALVALFFPWLVWATGLASAVWLTLSVAVSVPWLARGLYLTLVLGGLSLAALPLAWYAGHVVARQYGLSRQSLLAWLVDFAKASVIGLLLGVAGGLVFYAVADQFGELWWLPVGLLFTISMVVLAFLVPYLLVPLFYRMRVLEDAAVVQVVQRLADRVGASLAAVCTLDFSRKTAEANAAVIGFGRSRRVVLADTLLQTFDIDEVEAVVAHELGHHLHRDLFRLLAIQSTLLWGGLVLVAILGEPLLSFFGAGGLDDPASLPLLLLFVELFSLATLPVVNLLSRRMEASADEFAVQLTQKPAAFAAAMWKLANQNLAEPSPPRWAEVLLHGHPSIVRRVAAAERYARAA